jgi:hypothetical protein
MAYQERGSGPPHFDGKNYQMWSKRMAAFLHGKGQILWDVMVDTSYVQPMNFLAPGSRYMFDANNKAVDYLFRALCQPEFDRVHTEHLACRVEAIVELEKYDTLTANELFSKLKSVEVDRGMTAKIEGPTDSHSLALVGGLKGKANTNPSTRMFSLSSLMSMPDQEFDVLGEDELALLARRFERLHENRVNMRRNTRTCFQCVKP